MTKNEEHGTESRRADIARQYGKAQPVELKGEAACSSSVEAGATDFLNTVYADSREAERRVTVNPTRIEKSIQALQRNRNLQKRGLG